MEITREELADALGRTWLTVHGKDGLASMAGCFRADTLVTRANGQVMFPEEVADGIFTLVEVERRRAEPPPEPATGPSYCDGRTGMQPFDVIDEFGLDFYEGNVVKYVVRWRKKGGVDDLRKARTYLNRIIAAAEAQAVTAGAAMPGVAGG